MWSHLVGIMTKRGRKPRANFSPACAGVESTAPNLFQPLRKRVADMKHGFESRWGHHRKFTRALRFLAIFEGDARHPRKPQNHPESPHGNEMAMAPSLSTPLSVTSTD